MAVTLPIVSEFVDKGVKSAEAAFKNFRTKVGEADGAMNKFKAGAGASLNFVKANAASLATAGGAALVAFGAKAVTAFQDLALEAGKFSAATGLAVDDASRWIEVAGDLGIDSGAIQTAIGKMNKELGNSPELLRRLGDDIIYANDGTVNTNETFLKLIERLKDIKDPTEKAKEAARLFGKGWQETAELINMSTDDIRTRLAGVSDAKVINQEELRKAREFRDAMDNLKDRAEEFALKVGQELVPILADTATVIGKIADGIAVVTENVYDFLEVLPASRDAYGGSLDVLARTFDHFKIKATNTVNWALAKTNSELDAQANEYIPKVTRAWDEFLGRLDASEALTNLKTDVQEVSELLAAAFSGEQIDTAELDGKVIDAQQSIGKFVGTLLDTKRLTEDQANRIKVLVETGDLERAVQLLDRVQNPTKGAQYTPGFGTIGFRAAGGPVAAGQSYIVGERGPELFTPSTAGSIAASGSFGAPSITVNMPSGASGDDVVRAIQRWVRDNGAVPMTTTTAIRR